MNILILGLVDAAPLLVGLVDAAPLWVGLVDTGLTGTTFMAESLHFCTWWQTANFTNTY